MLTQIPRKVPNQGPGLHKFDVRIFKKSLVKIRLMKILRKNAVCRKL